MRPTTIQPRIEDPVEVLLTCHNKVRRFSRLLHSLVAHVAGQGADGQARSAALGATLDAQLDQAADGNAPGSDPSSKAINSRTERI